MNSVLVCGSRRWTDFWFMCEVMAQLRELLGDFQLIHGGARGADIYSGIVAKLFGMPEPLVDRPDYERYGRYDAPKLRNTAMLMRRPDYVVAFYFGGGGTADTIAKAINVFRIPTLVYRRKIVTAFKHGESEPPTVEYTAWKNMIRRCIDPKQSGYVNYGGRGITICPQWFTYSQFLADMGRKPSLGHSLERKDNNKGYEPGNCEWATRKKQSRNTRFNKPLTIDGTTRCIAEWAEVSGLALQTLYSRVSRGWPINNLLLKPARRMTRHATQSN